MRVFSYWSGVLTWMEHLSIASIKATGHDLTIYSYEPNALRGYVDCRVADARDVMDDPATDQLRARRPVSFSNNFRLEGIDRELGVWLDLDIIMLKAIPNEPHLFGWESQKQVCTAVMNFPRECLAFQRYLDVCRRDPNSNEKYWHPWWRRLNVRRRNWVRKMQGRPTTSPKLGPATLTHIVTTTASTVKLIKPAHIFYPVPPTLEAMKKIGQRGSIEGVIKPDTVCVHLWRSLYHSTHGMAAPRSGWIRNQMETLRVRERQLAPT